MYAKDITKNSYPLEEGLAWTGRRGGFTFVEITVVSAIALAMLGVMYTLFFRSFSGVEAGKARLENLQDTALTLEYIKLDIRGGFFGKAPIKGAMTDGGSLFKSSDGSFEFVKIYYDDGGEEILRKISYSLDASSSTITRTEEGGPSKQFCRRKAKKLAAKLEKGAGYTFVDVTVGVDTQKGQTLELRKAVFPKDMQAVNRNWSPNAF